MRLWSIHPTYLDSKGLSGLWREALLAKKILQKKTTSYKNHPQMRRFNALKKPVPAINTYLRHVYNESCKRNFCFDKKKIGKSSARKKIALNSGQLDYEFRLLKRKLSIRARKKYKELLKIRKPDPHPLFKVVKGPVALWEKV